MRNRSRVLLFTLLFAFVWAVPAASGPGFRSRSYLEEHFQKHGAEFGQISVEQYLTLAQGLRDAPLGGDILRSDRSGGGYAKYDRISNSFGAYDQDGTIRSFFKPNDGERYFVRQARIRKGND
ncbi:MAG: hypothetical protein M3Z36_12015 [Acidobacteriota bacterium]|nr:hypothetical protein [Acidobacteriota bacterium]